MDSDSVKKALMKQVLQEANMANARVLIEVRMDRLAPHELDDDKSC